MKHDENENQDRPNGERTRIVFAWRDGLRGRSCGKCNAAISGDVLGELPGCGFDAAAVVSLKKKRTHETACVAGAGVGDYWFEAVADFDSIGALRRRDEQEDTTIFFFAADAELRVEVIAVLLDGFAFERTNGDNGHLRAGFSLDLQAESFEAGFGVRMDDVGEIGDVAGGVNVLDVFSRSNEG